MPTNAGSLLNIMKVRLETKRAVPSALAAFQMLIDKLLALDPAEAVEVQVVSPQPLHARYVRVSTGEVLAELHE
jgi:hypothetical protein